jgi:hypothetical protein
MTPHDLGLVIQVTVWAAVLTATAVLGWLAAVAVTVIRAARAGRELGDALPGYPVPDSFPAIGARGGTAPMDAVGDEVDRMLGGSDRDD